MRRPFSAWRQGALLYTPPLFLGLLMGSIGYEVLAVACTIVGLAVLLFFRDPKRIIPETPGAIVSPADGMVTAIELLENSPHYDGPCKRISIFLSVFNVHVNRMPAQGTIQDICYVPGTYKNAMNHESGKCNTSNTIKIDTAYGPMTIRQISGAIARRIVCIPDIGDTLAKGEKFGMIRFGSRTELYLPIQVDICVTIRESVRAGTTIVARLP